MRKRILLALFSLATLCSCSDTPPEKLIRLGMTYEEVEDILGKPEMIREGITYVDSSVMVIIGRGSTKPVINTSSINERASWSYDYQRVEELYVTMKRGKAQEKEIRRYYCTTRFAVVFDVRRGKVANVGYYPIMVSE